MREEKMKQKESGVSFNYLKDPESHHSFESTKDRPYHNQKTLQELWEQDSLPCPNFALEKTKEGHLHIVKLESGGNR